MMLKIKRYIKKPIPVEAVFLAEDNLVEVIEWIESNGGKASLKWPIFANPHINCVIIHTLEGKFEAYPQEHYIVKGVKGEFYPVEKEIFEETYEEVPDRIDAKDRKGE